jgi:diphosphomevalonate decarboxylase
MTDHYFNTKYLEEGIHLQNIQSSEKKLIGWTSPSNIALIKYWGKYGDQMPENPSLSFTLSRSVTQMNIECQPCTDKSMELEFYLDGILNTAFEKKIGLYLKRLLPYLPFLDTLHFKIESHNTFPHSAGIASSASSYSALALCLCSIEQEYFNSPETQNSFQQKASFLARIGSGSACRSIYGPIALWGQTPFFADSSNETAIAIHDNIDPVFDTYFDAIIIADSSPKKISSTTGHILMDHHPYAKARYMQAGSNLHGLLNAISAGDELKFSQIVENEALSLHGLLLSSMPGTILLHPNTINIIRSIQEFRTQHKLNFAFTLDAGSNVHILYAENIRQQVLNLIDSELKTYCENGTWIDDKIGGIPVKQVNI